MTAGRIIYPGATGGAPVVAEWLSGKEAETATVTFATPDGNVITYSAGGLRAFEGQLARAEVERQLAGQLADLWKTITPEVKTGLVDAICLSVTTGLCRSGGQGRGTAAACQVGRESGGERGVP